MINVENSELNIHYVEPLRQVEHDLLKQHEKIETWFESQWQLTKPPFYGSVDLRNAGFKLAPIDMNLFPAGFNNLNPTYLSIAVDAAKRVLETLSPGSRRILIIAESHTRNLFYWESAKVLADILRGSGCDVRFAMVPGEHPAVHDITLPSGGVLQVGTLTRQGNELCLGEFTPELILLNNDLSDGIPDILQQLSQPLIPPAALGWSHRLKSEHFQYYAQVVQEFAAHVNIDPWVLSPLFRHCGQIDFMQREGIDCLISNAEALFAAIESKYATYQIKQQPFLIIKADAGTYGMAVMTVRHVDELRELNRKQRTRMSMTKGGQPVHRVILQEGIYTFETLGEEKAVAEPVMYLFGDTVVGGFYRVHQNRGVDENLNAPGMRFEPLAFQEPCNEPCHDKDPYATQNRFYIYGVVAKLSMLAAAREIHIAP